MLRDHDYDALVTETLGHAAAATGLIAQSLKFDGAVTLQILGGSALQMLVMQVTSDLDVRGMAAVGEGAAPQDFAGLTRDSQCAVTVDSGGRPYQGIVEITGASLAASLEHYFDRSMQVPSHIALVADADVAIVHVGIVEVDDVGLQPPQALFALALDLFGAQPRPLLRRQRVQIPSLDPHPSRIRRQQTAGRQHGGDQHHGRSQAVGDQHNAEGRRPAGHVQYGNAGLVNTHQQPQPHSQVRDRR